jgi:hypothetical protein
MPDAEHRDDLVVRFTIKLIRAIYYFLFHIVSYI